MKLKIKEIIINRVAVPVSKIDEGTKSGPSDKVGYKSPPKHSRFQPGVSGNPHGRRKKEPPSFETAIEEIYGSTVAVSDGKTRRLLSVPEVLIRKELELATKGDFRALRSCIDRMEKLGFMGALPWPKDLNIEDLTDQQLDQLIRRLKAKIPASKTEKP